MLSGGSHLTESNYRKIGILFAAMMALGLFLCLAPSVAASYELDIYNPIGGTVVDGIVIVNGTADLDDLVGNENVFIGFHKEGADPGENFSYATDVSLGGDWSEWRYEWKSGTAQNGDYTVTMSIRNGQNDIIFDTVDVEVDNEDPASSITHISSTEIAEEELLDLEGKVTFLGDGSAVDTYEWWSDIDGHIGDRQNFTGVLGPGTHMISYRVRNDAGSWSSRSYQLVKVTGLPNASRAGYTNGFSGFAQGVSDPTDLMIPETGWWYRSGDLDMLGNHELFSGGRIDGLVVVNDVAYCTVQVDDMEGRVVAVDAAGLEDGLDGIPVETADLLWSYDIPHPVGSAIMYYEGTVFIGTQDGYLYALDGDVSTGMTTELWDRPFKTEEIMGDLLTVVNDKLIAGTYSIIEEDATAHLWVINPDNGQSMIYPPISFDEENVTTVPAAAGQYLFVSTIDGLYALDVETLEQLWTIPYVSKITALSAGSSYLLVGTEEGSLYCYDYTGKPLWGPLDVGVALNDPVAITPDRLFVAGTYHKTNIGHLIAVDPVNGTIEWDAYLSSSVSGPATATEDKVFISTFDGNIYAFDGTADDNVSAHLWTLGYDDYALSEVNQSFRKTTPLIVMDGRMYFGAADHVLYTIGDFILRPVAKVTEVKVKHGKTQPPLTLYHHQQVTFTGEGITYTGDNITAYSWESDKDGVLATKRSFATEDLSEGDHVVTFKVTDDNGDTSFPVELDMTVLPNQLPVLKYTITNKIGGKEIIKLPVDEKVTFDLPGSSDPNGDEDLEYLYLLGETYNFEWVKSNKYTTIYLDKTPRGEPYNVTLIVRDSHGVESEPVYLQVAVVSSEEEEDGISNWCLPIIIILLILIIIGLILYHITKEDEEVDDVDMPVRPVPVKKVAVAAPVGGVTKLKVVKRTKRIRVKKLKEPEVVPAPLPPPAKGRAEIEFGSPITTEDISLDELSRRLESLTKSKEELERVKKMKDEEADELKIVKRTTIREVDVKEKEI